MTKTAWEGIFVACLAAVLVLCGITLGVAKDQWSGWVQAIGSIAAIVFAIWLSQQERTLKARSAADTAWIFIYGFGDALDWSFNAAYANNSEGLRVWHAQLVEYLRVGRSIDLSLLDHDMRGLVVRICGIGAQYEALYAAIPVVGEVPEDQMYDVALRFCSLYCSCYTMLMRPDLNGAHKRLDLHTRKGVADLPGDGALWQAIEHTYNAAMKGHEELMAARRSANAGR